MLEFPCPHCKTVLKVPERFAGSTGKCRKCGNTITITVDGAKPIGQTPRPVRPPELIALHLVTTGNSSRRDTIVEIGAVKFGLGGNERDSFWSFANSGESLSDSIATKTGITNDMLAGAPFPFEALREFFEWAGPDAVLFTEHAHIQAKFLCAAFLREDFEPPTRMSIVDVCSWAEQLEIRAPEYRLRPLLGAIGYSQMPDHRAMESARALMALVSHLLGKEAGNLPKEDDTGVWNRLMGKRPDDSSDPRLYHRIHALSSDLEEVCGPHFRVREQYEQRKRMSDKAETRGTPTPMILHMPEWYEEKKRVLVETKEAHNGNGTQPPVAVAEDDRIWAEPMRAASKSHDPEEQRKLLLKAVSLGARDPWPYERLTGFFIKMRDYHSAQKVCQRYFDGDIWRLPHFADSSWRLLDRMERLERRLSGAV